MTLLVAAVVVAGLYFGRDILIPLALAVLLSFLLAPVVRAFRRLGRVAAVGVAGLVGFLPVVAIVATVAGELPSLADDLPGYKQNVESKIRALPGLIPGDGIVNRLSALLAEDRHRPALRSAATVCLSLVSTSSLVRARYLVRRLRRRAPQARLLVGVWGGGSEVPIAEAAAAIAADRVVASLRDAAADLAAAAPAEAALAQ